MGVGVMRMAVILLRGSSSTQALLNGTQATVERPLAMYWSETK